MEMPRKVKEYLHKFCEYMNEQCIVELTASIGYWGMVARFLVPLQIDIDAQPAGSAKDLTGRKS